MPLSTKENQIEDKSSKKNRKKENSERIDFILTYPNINENIKKYRDPNFNLWKNVRRTNNLNFFSEPTKFMINNHKNEMGQLHTIQVTHNIKRKQSFGEGGAGKF